MVRGALIAVGLIFWFGGLMFLACGLTKIEQMNRKNFRYDLDMYRSKKEIWRSTVTATLWSIAIGTIFVIAGNW